MAPLIAKTSARKILSRRQLVYADAAKPIPIPTWISHPIATTFAHPTLTRSRKASAVVVWKIWTRIMMEHPIVTISAKMIPISQWALESAAVETQIPIPIKTARQIALTSALMI